MAISTRVLTFRVHPKVAILERQIEHEDIVVPHSHGAAIPAAVGQSITGRERERCTQFCIAVGKDALANATVTLPDLGVRDSTATSRSG